MKFRLLAILLGASPLTGCAPPSSVAHEVTSTTLLEAATADTGSMATQKQRHVLALSSGGADGAFGAGVLVGWSEASSRPVFDIVSGVSVGALQAPLAFLGQGYNDTLETLFTTTRTDDVFDKNGLGTLIKSGLRDADPLRYLLRRVVTPAMLQAIAQEHRRGRRLFVTTMDLTHGRSVNWDLGKLATSKRADARDAFIAILVASASPPGIVEPASLIDPATGAASLHGDGGLQRPIAVEKDMLTPRDTLWVIANGHVSRIGATSLPNTSTMTLARRGISQILRSLIFGSALEAAQLARDRGAAYRLQRLPITIPEAKSPFDFDPVEMRALFEIGRAQGRNSSSWLDHKAEATDARPRRR